MLKTSIKDYVAIKKTELKEKISELGFTPKLVVIQVGDNPASNSYIAGKKRDCEEVGIEFVLRKYPVSEVTSSEELYIDVIKAGRTYSVDGVIVQLPLPDNIDATRIQRYIPWTKDVDGFRVDSPFEPCTPLGIINYLKYNDYQFEGKDALVIGRSDIVGKPLARMLTDLDCTVTLAHSKSGDIYYKCKLADIIFTCIDKIEYFDAYADFLGCVDIVDIGLGRNAEGKLAGNLIRSTLARAVVEGFDDRFIISGPGGVGLLTRLTLLENVYKAALIKKEKEDEYD